MVNDRGKKFAITSLILGIASIVFCFFGISSVVSVGAGIVGIIMAIKAKNEGFVGGMRTAGFVTSIVGLSLGAIMLLFMIICGGLLFALSV